MPADRYSRIPNDCLLSRECKLSKPVRKLDPTPFHCAQFLYDGDALVAEYNGSGTLQRRYVHGAGMDTPVLWYEGSGLTTRRGLLADHQGSIIAVVNAAGSSFAINGYDSWGVPNPGNQGRFQYTGQAWIPEIELYHYKARIYSPTLGRFLQTDPVGYEDQMNLYAYVGNDPMNASDPSGQSMCNGPCNFSGAPRKTVTVDEIQSSLDVAGFAGPVGPLADAANAMISLARGNFSEAAVNAIAMVPVLGDGIKSGKMLAKGADAVPSAGPLKNPSGNLDGAADAARNQRHNSANVTQHAQQRMATRDVSSARVQEAADHGSLTVTPGSPVVDRTISAAESSSGRALTVIEDVRTNNILTVIDKGSGN